MRCRLRSVSTIVCSACLIRALRRTLAVINPESLIIKQGYAEPSLKAAEAGKAFQFEREGYFCPTAVTARQKNRYLTVPSVCVIRTKIGE